MRAVLDAVAAWFPHIDESGACAHPCCASPCTDQSHTVGEIAWPPLEATLARAESDLADHRGPLDAPPHPPLCHSCRVLAAVLHDVRLTASLVARA